MNTYFDNYNKFLMEFGKGRTMVLSSSESNVVTSRMMSVVCLDDLFYFQTDKTFRKYHQLINNPRVALCIDNIQIEGICEEIGHPMDFPAFCDIYRECFNGSFRKYSDLQNERLFAVRPSYIERWVYIDGSPFVEIIDIEKHKYELNKYEGV